ncbi:MAG: NUDIX hydrolase, partial [Clostridiales bacterium]|nr:NUDIX hydrolase [Clostridiales bacterium]
MDSARDRRGKTEEEFLREYDVTQYFRPSVTVDGLLYCPVGKNELKLLMIKRGGHPFIGKYAVPGGFVEKDEPCEVAVKRELEEETCITGVPLRQLVTVSTPDRDPRWRNITVVFSGRLSAIPQATAGDDAASAKWFDVRREGNTLYFSCDDEQFVSKLDIVRDEFGDIDLNETKIVERGLT